MIAWKKKVKEFWDLPKGVLESGERGTDAALREAKEEAGIQKHQLVFIENFKVTVRYFTRRDGKPTLKFAVFFLARAKTKKVKLSWEHDRYEWLLYRDARARLSLPQMQRALNNAEKFLLRHDKVRKKSI